jgi:hypothetical protein
MVKLKYLGEHAENIISIQGASVNISVDKNLIIEVDTKIARLLLTTKKFEFLKKKKMEEKDDDSTGI